MFHLTLTSTTPRAMCISTCTYSCQTSLQVPAGGLSPWRWRGRRPRKLPRHLKRRLVPAILLLQQLGLTAAPPALLQAQLVLAPLAPPAARLRLKGIVWRRATLQRKLMASQSRAGGRHGTAFPTLTRIGTCVRSAAGRWPRSHVVAGPKSAKRTSRSHTSLARDACSP